MPHSVLTILFSLGLVLASHSADLNNDGQVNQADLSLLIADWTYGGAGDLNHDGATGFSDAGILFSNWGIVPPPPPPPPPTPPPPPPPVSGMVPLIDLLTGFYLGQYQGGLYPGGTNTIPTTHLNEGVARANSLQPLDTNGNPSPTGKIILLSLGMSNATQEYCSGFNGDIADQQRKYWPNVTSNTAIQCHAWPFAGQAWTDPAVEKTTLTIVDGAKPGVTAEEWAIADDPWNFTNQLASVGLSTNQVQAIWMKHGNLKYGGRLSQGLDTSEAVNIMKQQATIVRKAKTYFPNVKLLFVSSRTYAGYSLDNLNPEPQAYEAGFGAKWLIEAQINQIANGGTVVDTRVGDVNYSTGVAPWLGWGPYLWADDNNPNSQGLAYVASDFDPSDGRHPAVGAETKVGTWLLNFFKTSPVTKCWFLTAGICP